MRTDSLNTTWAISAETIFIILMLLPQMGYPQQGGHAGGSASSPDSISLAQRAEIRQYLAKSPIRSEVLMIDTVRFADPMGNGGINSSGKTVTNYVDLHPESTLLDYQCGAITYNGHRGTDIEILNFYEMDEGVPVLSAAPGEVVYAHDGEPDRQTEWISGTMANAVIVRHADLSEAGYFHFRKNSVLVSVGAIVETGDTLGFVGSSGYSSGPHIHFEIQQNGTVDPYFGSCQPEDSRWLEQGAYVFDLPFELMDHGLTTIPLPREMIFERPPTKTHVQAPGPIYSWVRLRNALSTDELTWEFYANGSLWNTVSFSPSATYSSSWWYVWWNLPSFGDFGNWTIKIYRNGNLIAEQNFAYDNQTNQLPIVADSNYRLTSGTSIEDEFRGNDPDGSIFWYEIVSNPAHGTLKQFGGRKRKFIYTPDEGFTGWDSVVLYSIDDENAQGVNGTYNFEVVDYIVGTEQLTAQPKQYSLWQNYPNPFNPVTTINFDLPNAAEAYLVIYDFLGREVITLIHDHLGSGYHQVQWDGRDEAGREVASGIYFARLLVPDALGRGVTPEYTKSIKMVYLK